MYQQEGPPPGGAYGGPPPQGGPPGQGYGPPPGGPPPGQGYGPPPGQMGGPPPGQGYGPPPGQMGGPPPGQGYGPPPGQMGGPPPGQGYGPPPGQMGGPPPGQGYGPPPGQMGGPPPGQGYGPPPGQGGPPPPGAPMPGAPQSNGPPPWQPGQGGPFKWDDVPDENTPFDDNAPDPAFGAPPMDNFQNFQGYEGVGGFGQPNMMPPPPPPPPPAGDPPHMKFDSIANLSEDACREAMLDWVSQNCCYGKAPAQDMTITSVKPSSALHYILETYCEGRSTGYKRVPYCGGFVDGPQNGLPPPPWHIPCSPDQMFVDQVKKIEVPHTATVQPCHGCNARGFLRCPTCHGRGTNRCHTCGGDGRRTVHREGQSFQETCFSCGGSGRKRCTRCGGDGRITCTECKGYRELKCYIELTVNYVNHKSDHIIEETDMPDELVRDVQGSIVFEQILPQVWPIIAYPVQEINDNSVRLVESHRSAFPNERQLNQRQQLRAVPVTECSYTWKDVNTRFWVYGKERKVYTTDYPQTCCWGCAIL